MDLGETSQERTERRILDAIERTPMTVPEIRHHLGMADSTAKQYIRRMHKRGAIHIDGWRARKGGGTPAAEYLAGPGKDADASGESLPAPEWVVPDPFVYDMIMVGRTA